MDTCWKIRGKQYRDVELNDYLKQKLNKTHRRELIHFEIDREYVSKEEAEAAMSEIKRTWGHDAEMEVYEGATAAEMEKWWDEVTEGGTKRVYLP